VRDHAVGLARLGGALRARGVATTLRDEMDGASALTRIDLEDREEVRTALRIALKIPRAAFETFDRLFASFWDAATEGTPDALPRRPREAPALPRGNPLRWDPDTRRMGDAAGETREGGEQPGWSPRALLRRRPFDQVDWTGPDLVAMERLLARLARRLATRRSRRLVPTLRRQGRPDLRASYRRALRTSGELLSIGRRLRAVEEPRLVFLLDTSGSMDAHGRFLLTFILALRRGAPSAELFAFNTELVHLTPSLAPGKLRLTLERIQAAVPDWSGGTRIGECLATFVSGHLKRHVDQRTVVIILSDGLDRGDPAGLAEAVKEIRLRARKLIWLNPLLGDSRYEPTARGMEAALPYVDHFASAHNLESLERLVPHLAA
jgi:uncharacterized protein with von Willebrand factor type A (vWA) domain